MTQVTRLECDVCGTAVAVDQAGDWWTLQLARRGATEPAPQLTPMDQQMFSQIAGNAAAMAQMPPGMTQPGGPLGIPVPAAEVFGAPTAVDVCSSKCAIESVRESMKPPKKVEVPAEG